MMAEFEKHVTLYRITERRDGATFRTEPAGERWVPMDAEGEIEPDVFIGVLVEGQGLPFRKKHGYGTESDCICGRNFTTVRGLREHLTKARLAEADAR